MKTKFKYIVLGFLLFGLSGFNSAKAITADELLVVVQQFAGQVVQAFTQVGKALGDHETRISDNEAKVTALEAAYVIGDTGPAGGWVFYVDAEGRHGLEAAPADRRSGIQWYNGAITNTEANGDGLGAGEMNTMLIIANQGSDSTTYAAGISASLVITSAGVDYSDWYLPSKYELNLMYLNIGPGSTKIGNVGGFTNVGYWSSSEFSSGSAWSQFFDVGGQFFSSKVNSFRVRAVRAF